MLALIVGTLFLGLASAHAEGTAGSAVAKWPYFDRWSDVYAEMNGDREVVVRVATSRNYVTERIDAHGYVRLDLIGGKVAIELSDLDRAVDVWLLDNKPGPDKSILPEDGDVLIQLGRLAPTKDGVARLEADFGPDRFQGVEVNWILVSEAGVDPATSRLLYGTRSYLENLYTRQRLDRAGFVEKRIAPEVTDQALSSRDLGAAPFGANPNLGSKAPVANKAVVIVSLRPHKILAVKGLVSEDVFRGGEVFFRETFEGNGRSCGTCHPPENNQTIDVPFINLLSNADPLFVAEQRPPSDPISNLERPPLMRNFGLILENVDGLEDPNNKFLMRGVPHSLSMATSIMAPPGNPDVQDHTGWSGDGAPSPGRLREFLLGAIIQHYPNNSLAREFKEDVAPGYPFDFRMPTDRELDLTNEFMLNVGRLSELDLPMMSLTDASAEAGRTRFINSGCNGCHNNASSNVATGLNLNFFTGVERLPNPAQGFAGINFPLDGGFGGQGLNAFTFDCDGDGTNDCFGNGQFNSVGLIESADTPPFFHNNVAATLENAVAFYQAAPFPAPLGFTPAEVDNVGGFLRVINASFNLQMGVQRTLAALDIEPDAAYATNFVDFAGIRGTSNRLILLAAFEVEDAYQVLTGSPLGTLNPDSVVALSAGFDALGFAFFSNNFSIRTYYLKVAAELLSKADAGLGSGTGLVMGEGNLLF